MVVGLTRVTQKGELSNTSSTRTHADIVYSVNVIGADAALVKLYNSAAADTTGELMVEVYGKGTVTFGDHGLRFKDACYVEVFSLTSVAISHRLGF